MIFYGLQLPRKMKLIKRLVGVRLVASGPVLHPPLGTMRLDEANSATQDLTVCNTSVNTPLF